MTTARATLAAAQTARAAARINFNRAVERATDRAIAAGVRGVAAIDKATEADAEVIAARVVTANAIATLKSAEAAASREEREVLEMHAASAWSQTYGEGTDRFDPNAGME